MARTLIIADEIALGTDAANGSSVSNATVVRLYNGVGSTCIVSMASTVGAADTVSFSMPTGHVEFLEKPASYVVWASSASVKATKVGFTG
jgi:hypothetical protein